MSETKFTPGPWDKFELIIGRMVDNRHRYTSIASIYESEPGYEGEDKANAHLIAAAPELYEALERMKIWCEDEVGAELPCDSINAALAKARGETPA